MPIVPALRRAALVLAFACVAAACGASSGDAASASAQNIPGVVIERAAGRSHREGHIDYPGKHPPSGGDHNPVWLNCGFYAQQPPDEFALHSLEHGSVWIAFDPKTSAADVGTLQQFASPDHVLVTPYAGMDTPITLVAWEHRLEVSSASDPRIKQFVDAFRNASSAPEKGGACSGGTGTPAT
jgi:hypothetical protein